MTEAFSAILEDGLMRFLLGFTLACVALLAGGIPRASAQYKWELVRETAAFAPRDGAGAITKGGYMFLIGGWNPSDKVSFPKITSNDVWRSIDGSYWERIKRNTNTTWEPRHSAGYVVLNNMMWIVGGDPIQGHYQGDVWNSRDGVNWTHVNAGKPAPWGPRVLHTTIAMNGAIYVMGGQTLPQYAPAPERRYNDVWRSYDGVNWTKLTISRPMWSPRGMIVGSVVFNGRMYIIGGGLYDTPGSPRRYFYTDVWSSSNGAAWRYEGHAPWPYRQYHNVAVWDNKIWVIAGWNNADINVLSQGNLADAWYSEDGRTWTELPDVPFAPRHASSVFVHQDALWVVTGNNMQSDVWRLSRETAVSNAGE